jgi:hypothetical protein
MCKSFFPTVFCMDSLWYVYNLCQTFFVATGWTIRVLGFDFRRKLGIFLFITASRTALGPMQPPIQRVLGALSLGVKRPGREAGHSSPSSAEFKEWVELYLHSPNAPSWRGAQLKHRDKFTFNFYLYRILKKYFSVGSSFCFSVFFVLLLLHLSLRFIPHPVVAITNLRIHGMYACMYVGV